MSQGLSPLLGESQEAVPKAPPQKKWQPQRVAQKLQELKEPQRLAQKLQELKNAWPLGRQSQDSQALPKANPQHQQWQPQRFAEELQELKNPWPSGS